MERALALLASPAGLAALIAVVLAAPITGFVTWPALARARIASTVAISLAVGLFTYALVSRLVAQSAG